MLKQSMAAVLLVSTYLAGNPAYANQSNLRRPELPQPAPADADMQAVLDALASLHPKAIESLTPAQARKQPSPADGVKLVMKENGLNPADNMGVVTTDVTYKVKDAKSGKIIENPARVYVPEDFVKGGGKTLPIVVYYHGGGWVIADLDTYDATPRAISKAANAMVVSVEYRHAPEHKFPAAHDDAFAAYKWVLANAAAWGGDVDDIAVMGESAGANLAINTSIRARDEGVQEPEHQVLIYPVAGVDMNTESYVKNADAKPLNKTMMAWFMKHVLKSEKDKTDPRLDLVGKADLRDLPDTTIITAEIDPLQSEGQKLADKLRAADVDVKIRNYEGVTHEFFGMAAVVAKAKDAQAFVVEELDD